MVNCWIIEAENQNALDHPKLDALNLQIETKLVVKLCVLHALCLCMVKIHSIYVTMKEKL